jgi:L-threonylcarbamoyladenylate synthase
MTSLSSVDIARAAAAILRGEVVAFPTETFYGLAVDALDQAALERLFALKGRDAAKASALLVADWAMFAELCVEIPARARALADAHWPGPLTLALRARPDLPSAIVMDGYVAARVPSHPVARALVAAVAQPITATSANPAGGEPAVTAGDVAVHFAGKALCLLDGGRTPGGSPSTLVRFRGEELEVLRQGAIVV